MRASAKEARKTCLWPPAPAVGRTAARIRRRDFGLPTVPASADANGADFQRSSTKDAQAASLANAAVRAAWLVLSRLNTACHPASRRIIAVSSRGSDSMPLSGVDAGSAPALAILSGASRVGYARRRRCNATHCNATTVSSVGHLLATTQRLSPTNQPTCKSTCTVLYLRNRQGENELRPL